MISDILFVTEAITQIHLYGKQGKNSKSVPTHTEDINAAVHHTGLSTGFFPCVKDGH